MSPKSEAQLLLSSTLDLPNSQRCFGKRNCHRGNAHTYLLHRAHADQVQRLLIACCVDTYVRPHHHPAQWELMSLIQGNADVITFDGNGCVAQRGSMARAPVVQIAQNVLHTIIITAPRSLLLEVKPSPFRPAEFPAWAPAESSPGAVHLLEQLKRPHTN
jgi:cupin fold WbuC family metalloprotein